MDLAARRPQRERARDNFLSVHIEWQADILPESVSNTIPYITVFSCAVHASAPTSLLLLPWRVTGRGLGRCYAYVYASWALTTLWRQANRFAPTTFLSSLLLCYDVRTHYIDHAMNVPEGTMKVAQCDLSTWNVFTHRRNTAMRNHCASSRQLLCSTYCPVQLITPPTRASSCVIVRTTMCVSCRVLLLGANP